MVKNIVEASAKKDISDAEVFEGLLMPKIFNKVYYCVACAIHNRIVRVRSRDDRKFRNETKIRMTVDLLQG
jgi:small subunit ribosomal protein S26e